MSDNDGTRLRDRVTSLTATGRVEYGDGVDSDEIDEAPKPVDTSDDRSDLDYQPVPDDLTCPYCGGDPTDVSERDHQLSAVGYLHDDIQMECADCGQTWPCGVPIGEYDGPGGEELFCSACEQRFMRVHRINADPDRRRERYIVHLKCPNCFTFTKIKRHPDAGGTALIGYPDITGDVANANPYGYQGDGPDVDDDVADDADALDHNTGDDGDDE